MFDRPSINDFNLLISLTTRITFFPKKYKPSKTEKSCELSCGDDRGASNMNPKLSGDMGLVAYDKKKKEIETKKVVAKD